MEIRLTEYSHGSGCGCKIAPELLETILEGVKTGNEYPNLIVGNDHKDDAAVMSIGDGRAIISTTDFFMPIVDDPYDFGRIAATNALSDIYAMGGNPLMAISIFGWPIDKLSEQIGKKVIEGGRRVCEEAGIPLAGGHSIDSPEPIFGLAVTGIIDEENIKANSGARAGDKIYLTKPLGIGILTTAEKRKILVPEDRGRASNWMLKANRVGVELAFEKGVTAITDVTGFGLVGHLSEICQASEVTARLDFERIPTLEGLNKYLDQNCTPGGTQKNYKTYHQLVNELSDYQKNILFDPQTSGGLLVTVNPAAINEVEKIFTKNNTSAVCIGELTEVNNPLIRIS
jgi:selenide,water dikinase